MKKRSLAAIVLFCVIVQSGAQSLQKLDSLQRELIRTGQDTGRVDIYNRISKIYGRIDYEKSILFADSARMLSEELDFEQGQIDACKFLGTGYTNLGDYITARKYLYRALELSLGSDDPFNLASSYNRLLFFYVALEDYDRASEYAFQALKIFEKIEDQVGMTTLLLNLGYIYLSQQNYEKSEEYSKKALEIAVKGDLQGKIAIIYNNLGVVYDAMEDHDRALGYYEKAAGLYASQENLPGLCTTCNNIGMIKNSQQKPDEALGYFFKSLTLARTLKDSKRIATSYNTLANHYFDRGIYDSSRYYINKALELAQGLNRYSEIADAALLLYKLNYKNGDFKAACDNYELYKAMTDSVFNQENFAKISTLETKYNLEKLEKELAFAEEQKRSANLQNLLIIISVVSVSAILLLVINRKRIKNRKDKEISELKLQQARREIEQNRNELRVFAARIKEKNKLIENLLQEFNQTNKEDLDMDGSGTELQLRKMKILSKEDWIKFKTLFRSVHQDFIERFSERFHHLTEGDLRQVMLIKLGFTLSQTADILGIGYAGVKKARQRLARKIDLGNTDSLVGFIDQFPEKGA